MMLTTVKMTDLKKKHTKNETVIPFLFLSKTQHNGYSLEVPYYVCLDWHPPTMCITVTCYLFPIVNYLLLYERVNNLLFQSNKVCYIILPNLISDQGVNNYNNDSTAS